jgi:hypothetical protein
LPPTLKTACGQFVGKEKGSTEQFSINKYFVVNVKYFVNDEVNTIGE